MEFINENATEAHYYLYGVLRGKTMTLCGRYQFKNGHMAVRISGPEDEDHKKLCNAMKKYYKVVMSYDGPEKFEIPLDPCLSLETSREDDIALDQARERERIEIARKKEEADRLTRLAEDDQRARAKAAEAKAKKQEDAIKTEAAKRVVKAAAEKTVTKTAEDLLKKD